MNLTFQRRADRIIGTFMCRVLSLFFKSRRDASNNARPQKILIILLSEMGSLILAQPMFDHIKEKYPEASLYVLLFEQNKEVLEILEVTPRKNILIINNASLKRFLRDAVHCLVKIRQITVDTVLDCELFSRISSIYSFLSGAKTRVGFHPHTQEGLFRGNFINRPVLYNPYQHISHQFITLVKALESNGIPIVKRSVINDSLKIRPIKVTQDEIICLLKRFKGDFPHINKKKLVLIYPSGGLLPIRAWPLQYFCQLSEVLIRNGYIVSIIGIESDKKIASVILSHCRSTNCIDLTGYTKSIRELMILFHSASLLISNDGGPIHFATMTPIQTIALFGPETPTLYGPLDGDAEVFYVPLSCSPCLTAYNHRNSPCDGDNLCLKHIPPDQVVTKALEILEGRENNGV